MIDTHMKARLKAEPSSLWQIMAIKEEGVALSGPGPCRMYQVVEHDTFERDWEVIWCRSANSENEKAHMYYVEVSNGHAVCTFCKRDDNLVYRGG